MKGRKYTIIGSDYLGNHTVKNDQGEYKTFTHQQLIELLKREQPEMVGNLIDDTRPLPTAPETDHSNPQGVGNSDFERGLDMLSTPAATPQQLT